MLPYWILFAMIAGGASLERMQPNTLHRYRLPLVLVGLLLTLMIGLRYKVGGDWLTYELIFDFTASRSFEIALESGDPGYQTLSWLIAQVGLDLWALNLVCALIFTWGLLELARNQPAPLLAILVALPYLVIVVAMGYTRQAAAIGFVMAGFAAVERGGGIFRFAGYVILGTLFHKTAMVTLPIVMLAGNRNQFINLVAGAILAVGLYFSFLADRMDVFVANYIDAGYQSQGAAIRVAMNFFPALLMLRFGDRLQFGDYQYRLWRIVAWVAIALVPALVLIPSSTAIDRLALYVLPIQMVVIPRAVMLFRSATVGRTLVVAYSAAVLAVWLLLAEHSRFWLPYRAYFVSETKRFDPSEARAR